MVVIYNPRTEYTSPFLVDGHYIEIWAGLPNDIPFQEAEAKDGSSALRYQSGDDYIWVNPNAVVALKRDPDTLLVVHGRQQKGNRICVLSIEPAEKVEPFKGNLATAIRRAKELTDDWLTEAVLKTKKNSLQRSRQKRI